MSKFELRVICDSLGGDYKYRLMNDKNPMNKIEAVAIVKYVEHLQDKIEPYTTDKRFIGRVEHVRGFWYQLLKRLKKMELLPKDYSPYKKYKSEEE